MSTDGDRQDPPRAAAAPAFLGSLDTIRVMNQTEKALDSRRH